MMIAHRTAKIRGAGCAGPASDRDAAEMTPPPITTPMTAPAKTSTARRQYGAHAVADAEPVGPVSRTPEALPTISTERSQIARRSRIQSCLRALQTRTQSKLGGLGPPPGGNPAGKKAQRGIEHAVLNTTYIEW